MAKMQTEAYRQWLATLESAPEAEAAGMLERALKLGTGPGGLTLARSDMVWFYEQLHHYYKCPNTPACDGDTNNELMAWEMKLLDYTDPANSAVDFAKTNMSDWTALSSFVRYHEPTIRERWLKKSAAQRKAVLLEALPGIPSHHRPDVDHKFIKDCCHQRDMGNLGHYSTPYLNLEDLMKPKSLLILTNARARNKPSTFAYSDHNLAPLLRLRPSLLKPTCITINLTSAYGSSIEWETEQAAAESIERGETVHPINACHILTLQRRINQFLRNCMRLIMHDALKRMFADIHNFGLALRVLSESASIPSCSCCGDNDRWWFIWNGIVGRVDLVCPRASRSRMPSGAKSAL